jgi:hypothetical protein
VNRSGHDNMECKNYMYSLPLYVMKWNQMCNYMADTTIKDMIFVLKTVEFFTYKRTVCIFQIAFLNLFRLSFDSIIACKEGVGAYILLWFLYIYFNYNVFTHQVHVGSFSSFYHFLIFRTVWNRKFGFDYYIIVRVCLCTCFPFHVWYISILP